MSDIEEKKPVSSSGSANKQPSDKINLKIIHVSGKTHEFVFANTDTVDTVTQHIYSNWPEGWADEERDETNILRLIYQGRFLHGNVSLRALQLASGRATVMHLVSRESLPDMVSRGSLKKDKGLSANAGGRPQARGTPPAETGCCASCVIL